MDDAAPSKQELTRVNQTTPLVGRSTIVYDGRTALLREFYRGCFRIQLCYRLQLHLNSDENLAPPVNMLCYPCAFYPGPHLCTSPVCLLP
jgi:hypothetical protein